MPPETVSDQSGRITALEARLEALAGVVERQAAELQSLRVPGTTATTTPAATAPRQDEPARTTSEASAGTLGRRRLLLGGAGAAVATAAAVASTASPASASNGDPLTLGSGANTATSQTRLTANLGNYSAVFQVEGQGNSSAIYAEAATTFSTAITGVGPAGGVSGYSTGGHGVSGYTYTAGKAGISGDCADAFVADGVRGRSTLGRGVFGTSTSGNGVEGGSTDAIGVKATSDSWLALQAYSNHGVGIQAGSGESAAIEAIGVTAPAIIARSPWSNLSLPPEVGRTAPTADGTAHTKGEIVTDATGNLWICVADGTPGTWRKAAGPTTSGAFHLLPVPIRVYDSRPGNSPAVGSKTKLSGNTARTLSMSANSSKVPSGATAVSVTLLLVNASTAGGNVTIWANGATRPQANAMVWGGTAGRFASTAVSRIDAATKLNVAASSPTDIVLDVVGYYL